MLSRVMCALLFLAWTAEMPEAFDPTLYCGLWRSPLAAFGPLFVSLPGIHLSAWQLALVVLAPISLFGPGAFRRRARALDAAIVISVASVAVSFAWGFMRGGSAYQAYYQLWRFLAALLVGLMLVAAITSSRHLKALGKTVLAAALVRATLAIYFFWSVVHGKVFPAPAYMTSHDDSVLFVAGIGVLLSWALARRSAATWAATLVGSGVIAYAIVLNNRRLAWIELILALVVMYLALPAGKVRRRVTQFALATAPIVVLYVLVGWNRPGALFAPVAALSTASSYEDSSALAREEEIRNLLYTLSKTSNPLTGTGWGMPYQKVTSVYANFVEWWQYAYMPHNSLLGVAVFGGFAGIFGMWIVVPFTAFLAMRGYRGATRAVHGAGALSALCILPAYGVQCYGDIGFQSLTGNLLLAVALATAAKTSTWAVVQPDAHKPARGPRRRPETHAALTPPAVSATSVQPAAGRFGEGR